MFLILFIIALVTIAAAIFVARDTVTRVSFVGGGAFLAALVYIFATGVTPVA